MRLFQVIRQVVPDRVIYHEEDEPAMVIPGLTQTVWEGKSRQTAYDQLKKARTIEGPQGTVYLIHESNYSG